MTSGREWRSVRASAPGKSILMGEHSVVYGAPALVAAVDLRVEVELTPVVGVTDQAPGVTFMGSGDSGPASSAPATPLRLPWSEILRLAVLAREAWSQSVADPLESLSPVLTAEHSFLVVALGEASSFLMGASQAQSSSLPELRLRVTSQLPIGAGMGSSAAVAVAVAGALSGSAGWAPKFEEIDAMALDIERRQHGRPSGIDHSTVLRGGVLWFERSSSDFEVEWMIEPLDLGRDNFRHFHLFDSGRPNDTTGETVAAVARYRETSPGEFDRTLSEMATATQRFREALLENLDPRDSIRSFQRCLEKLAVVPDRVRDMVREVECQGGAAKVSGAGAITGSDGGAMLVYHSEAPPDTISTWLDGCRHIGTSLGAEGLSIVVDP